MGRLIDIYIYKSDGTPEIEIAQNSPKSLKIEKYRKKNWNYCETELNCGGAVV